MADKVKGVVDIVFLMDATGSMQNCIDRLKENLNVFIGTLTTKDANNSCPVKDWRAKVVGYRDFEVDGSDWYEDNPFTHDAEELKRQLAKLVATGGGDDPESLLDAIYKLANMGQIGKQDTEDPAKWRYRSSAARVVIVFTDAPFTEKIAIPEAAGGGITDIINQVNSNRLILSIFAPPRPCYDELAKADKSEYEQTVDDAGNEVSLDVYTADQKKFQTTLKQLAASVSKSAAAEVL
jgi:Icc-related predicted phosphoesterase